MADNTQTPDDQKPAPPPSGVLLDEERQEEVSEAPTVSAALQSRATDSRRLDLTQKPSAAQVQAGVNATDVSTNQPDFVKRLDERERDFLTKMRGTGQLTVARDIADRARVDRRADVTIERGAAVDVSARLRYSEERDTADVPGGSGSGDALPARPQDPGSQSALPGSAEAWGNVSDGSGAIGVRRTGSAAGAPGTPPPEGEQPPTEPSNEGEEAEETPQEPLQFVRREAAPAVSAASAVAGKEVYAGWWEVVAWAYGFCWLVFPIFLLALAMDVYWVFFHGRNKDLFPLDFVQKSVTVLTNLLCAVVVGLIILLFAVIFKTICDNPVTYGATWLYSKVTGSTNYCSVLNGLPATSGQGAGTFSGSEGGVLSTSPEIQALIQSYAGQTDLCMLKTVVRMESRGLPNVIGCDCAANGRPELCLDNRREYSSDYRFNWDQCSYGIGITQWTIYPRGGSGYRRWCAGDTPSRDLFGDGTCYTVQDFLDPAKSLQLTVRKLNADYNRAPGTTPREKVEAAFRAYVGQSSWTDRLVADRMAFYDTCVAAGSNQLLTLNGNP